MFVECSNKDCPYTGFCLRVVGRRSDVVQSRQYMEPALSVWCPSLVSTGFFKPSDLDNGEDLNDLEGKCQ